MVCASNRYFVRGTFTLPALPRPTQAYIATVSYMVDDGVVLSINGQEVSRFNVGDPSFPAYVTRSARPSTSKSKCTLNQASQTLPV